MNVHLRAAVAALLVLAASALAAQAPYVVKTLSAPTSGGSANASTFTAVGDAIYFFARPSYANPDSVIGLWKWTEGNGAVLVKPLPQCTSSSSPCSGFMALMAIGDKALFAVSIDSRGGEFWITDGTSAGTTMLKDIYVGGSSNPVPAISVGTKAYFTAFTPENGRELWVTDGTEAGTLLVSDLTGDSSSSNPTAFVESAGRLFFHALGQLWVSDGTAAGTEVLASGVSASPGGVAGSEVFFLGSDETHGREVWSTDGTPAGTAMVADINPGQASSWGGIATPFVAIGSTLLFFADDPVNGRELWRTDGTEPGTALVLDITPGAESTSLKNLVSSTQGAFFLVDGNTLWFSDGSPAGTAAMQTFPSVIAMVGAANGAYLVTGDRKLHFSDGTASGTVEITGVAPGSSPILTAIGASAVFVGDDGVSGSEPWITDGTQAGTEMLGDLASSVYTGAVPAWMKAAGDKVFFRFGLQLFVSDASAGGTLAVGAWPDYPSYDEVTAALGSTLLYRGGISETFGLWRSDGTIAGTALVKPMQYLWNFFSSTGGYVLFVGAEVNDSYSRFLWVSDGTAAGTRPLCPSYGMQAVDLAGTSYLISNPSYSYTPGTQLWSTKGTPETTRLVMTGDFNGLAAAGGSLFFGNRTTAAGRELWVSDGTADGAAMVKDIVPGTGSSDPVMLSAVGNVLFFTALNASYGRELWRSDGTEAGTFLLRDLESGVSSSWISGSEASGRYFYFALVVSGQARELWRSDGTIAGTIQLSSGATYGLPVSFDGKVLFPATDPVRGRELWESDGTIGGTYVAFDLEPGAVSSNPSALTVSKKHLFFGTTDSRLWAMERAATRVSISDQRVVEGNTGSTALQFTVTRAGDLSSSTSVTWLTEDVTATAGEDYAAGSGTLSFSAGQATGVISIQILGDTAVERNESFALLLTGALGATIVDDRAFGVIEENDWRVALSLEYIPMASYYNEPARKFRITNAGPSGASVSLRISESPYRGNFTCGNANPAVCAVGYVPAGNSIDFTAHRQGGAGTSDASFLAGRTLTATVFSQEGEIDLSDNTISRMISGTGHVSLPSYLTPGQTATAGITSGQFPDSLSLSLTGGVVVSPYSAYVTEADPVASVSLSVAPSAWGWSTVSLDQTPLFRIPIVFPGEKVMLDTTIVFDGQDYYYGYQFDFGDPVVIPVQIVATLPDGTRPSGTVALHRTSDNALVQTQVLDSLGKATFTLSDLPVGTRGYVVIYSGDSSFNGLTRTTPNVTVAGYPTYMDAVLKSSPCGDPEILVTVRNHDGHTPTGNVTLRQYDTILGTVALQPTATAGYATASFTPTVPSWYSLQVTFEPTSPFVSSYDYVYNQSSSCPAVTMIASTASATSVALVWSGVGAASYEIVRSEAPNRDVFAPVGTTSATTFTDSSTVAGKAYLYKVHAKTTSGVIRSTSLADLATSIGFSNDPIAVRTTAVKAAHITQMQQATNAVRVLAGLSVSAFAPVASGGSIQAADLTVLQTSLSEALNVLGYPTPPWIAGVSSGSPIKAVHMQQLRNAVK